MVLEHVFECYAEMSLVGCIVVVVRAAICVGIFNAVDLGSDLVR